MSALGAFALTLRMRAIVGMLCAALPMAARADGPATAPASQPNVAPLIPRRVLFGNPERTGPQLSPDGSRLGYLAPVDGVLNVWVGGPDGSGMQPVTHDRDRGIRRFFFTHDGRHLFYLQDRGGDENWRLYSLDLESGDERDYTPFDDVQVRIVGGSMHRPRELLLGINKDDPTLHDVYRLETDTGELTLHAKNPGDAIDWITDPDLHVLGYVRNTPDAGQELYVRKSEDAPWTPLIRWDMEDSMASRPLNFTRAGRRLIMLDSRGRDTAALVRRDMATGATEVLAADPHYDISMATADRATNEIDMAAVLRERLEWIAVSEDHQADLARLQAVVRPNMYVLSRTNDRTRWIVSSAPDDASPAAYLYDRAAGTLSLLFHDQPALNEYTLAPMEAFQLTARDGLPLRGYLTFPVGVPRATLPAVLHVHGGPWSRNGWGLHGGAQWLANRGYLCVQVNFRGSTGYGKAFVNAGDREWGGKMHDDLIDTVRWLVAQGYADPERIAIYGGSYGGYAALVGATFTPDVFACAVDIVGPSNLITLLETIPPYWEPYRAVWSRRVGDPDKDAEFLKSRSPLFHVERITIPVLIAQGANDPRVKQAESEQIVAAMRERGLDYEYLLFPDEGHGFAKPDNRLAFAAAAERFLAKHLGGRYEPVGEQHRNEE